MLRHQVPNVVSAAIELDNDSRFLNDSQGCEYSALSVVREFAKIQKLRFVHNKLERFAANTVAAGSNAGPASRVHGNE
jgi:hypothetical protein